MAVLQIPGELMPAFWQFKQDFERVTAQWIARGEETEASISVARDGLRRYLAESADPDVFGLGRVERLQHLFAFWRELVLRGCPLGVAARPVLPLEVEVKHLEREWKGAR